MPQTEKPGSYSPWGHKESNTTDQLCACVRARTHTHTHTHKKVNATKFTKSDAGYSMLGAGAWG